MPAKDEPGSAATSWRRVATFRFYEELNDFLPEDRRKVSFEHAFNGTPSVKDTVESLGVPHPEIDLILVDGVSVGFEHRLHGDERVAVYPMFERLDVAPVVRLRPEPLRITRFVVDGPLGKLARYLRLLGFDTLHDLGHTHQELVMLSVAGPRILLTRDRGLLKRREITHGHWLRATAAEAQAREVVEALDLAGTCAPFSRCMVCNAVLEEVEEATVREELPPAVRARWTTLTRCPGCTRLFWPGSHYAKLEALVRRVVMQRP